MNILLLGLIGSGKTSIGKLLASRFQYNFIELDHRVLSITGFASVEEVFKRKKSLWEECEIEIMKDLSCEDNQVIACGGAMVLNYLNIQYFKENSNNLKIVYLETSIDELVKRTHHYDADSDSEEIKIRLKKILQEREFLYNLYTTHKIKTDGRTIRDIVLDIEKIII